MQVNGVVWATATVGNTTYATGNFDYARPAGMPASANPTAKPRSAASSPSTSPTGVMLATTSFRPPSLNASGYAIAASPDGKTIYVGGSFTKVNGCPRDGLVAFDAPTGAVKTNFAADVPGQVNAIVPTAKRSTSAARSSQRQHHTRTNLAAFDASTGGLTGWAPTATGGGAMAMVLAAGQSRPHRRRPLHHAERPCRARDGLSGRHHRRDVALGSQHHAARLRNPVRRSTRCPPTAALIYGGGYNFGDGFFEGRFAADPSTGKIIWVDDCHGDTYSTLPIGQVLYSTSHAHDCSVAGSFPEELPQLRELAPHPGRVDLCQRGCQRCRLARRRLQQHDGSAYRKHPRLVPDPGLQRPRLWPTPCSARYRSRSAQNGWDLSTNGTYMVVGGEMESAGDQAAASYLPNQQGLVRYNPPAPSRQRMSGRSTTRSSRRPSLRFDSRQPRTWPGRPLTTGTTRT